MGQDGSVLQSITKLSPNSLKDLRTDSGTGLSPNPVKPLDPNTRCNTAIKPKLKRRKIESGFLQGALKGTFRFK